MAAPIPYNLLQNVIQETQDALSIAGPAMVADAIRMAGKELPNVVHTLGQALDMKVLPKERLAKANNKIAENAQAAVVRGWRSRLPRKTWRGGPNRQTGLLGPALADPSMTAATNHRFISFINTDVLDMQASHWYRVNYGASGSRFAEGRTARRFVMQLDGSAFASFSDDLRPDPISWIPSKRYYDSDGNMYPGRGAEAVRSPYGARAARFFELGHSVVARETPQAYETLWRQYVAEKTDRGIARLQKKKINIKGDFRLQRTSWSARVRT